MTDKQSPFSSFWLRLRALWPIALVILLILLLIAPALSPRYILMPLDIIQSWAPWQLPNQPIDVQNFLLTDVVNYIVPMKQFLVESIKGGEFPLWNPYLFTGIPFTYNTQAGAWYPLTALYYLLPLTTAVDATIILQMILGALFMYGYLHQIKLKPLAAVTGAIIFIFNGLMVIWLEWQVVHAAIIWLPLQLWIVEKLRQKLRTNNPTGHNRIILFYSIILGIVFAIPWLGGHWNWTLYTSMTLAFYMLWRILPLAREKELSVSYKQLVLLFIITFGVGIGLSLIQVLPAFFYLAQSHRQGMMTYDRALTESLFNRLVVMFVPNFFGDPIQRNFWGPENYAETTFYLGILPLFLAVMAIFLRRDRITIFFTGVGIVGLLWALRTPLYYLLYILPVFSGLFPSRAIYLTVFSTAVLSALSIDVLQTSVHIPKRRLTIVLVLTFTIFNVIAALYFWQYRAEVITYLDYLTPHLQTAVFFISLSLILLLARLRGWLSPSLFSRLALLLIILDLFVFGYGYNTISSLDDWYGKTAVASFFHSDDTVYRIVTPAKGMVYPPNSAIVDQLSNISGYEPGILQRTVDYLNMVEDGNSLVAERAIMPLNNLDSPLLDAINVKYIPTTRDRSISEPQVGATQETITQWLPLTANTGYSHTFTMPDAGLHRIDIPLTVEATSTGTVTMRIFTGDGVLELANSTLDFTEIKDGEQSSFYFSALPSEWGRDFLMNVTTTTADNNLLAGANDAGKIVFTTYYLPRPNLVFEDGKSQIYLRPDHFSRTYFVPQALVVDSMAAAQTAVSDHANELDQLVILEQAGQPLPPDLGSNSPATSTVNIINYGLNRIEITAKTNQAGFLVLSDTYYPGWQATIDGERTPVYLANSLVRAIYLPVGQHEIVFSFWPPDFIIGAIVSGLILLACIITLIIIWKKRSTSVTIF